MNRLSRILLVAASALVLAGGVVHLREWLDVYRNIPSSVPGASVVTVGFPVNAAVSLVVAAALVIAIARARILVPVAVGALVFQVASLGMLIATREGTVLGWTEPIWTPAAKQSLVVDIGAIVALVIVLVAHVRAGRSETTDSQDAPDAARSRVTSDPASSQP